MTRAAYLGSLRFYWTSRDRKEAAGQARKKAAPKPAPRRPKKNRD